MKELAEIERTYIKDIVEFFCRKSFEIFGKNFLKSNSHDIISWIENKIKKRLFEPGIITDYRIIINFNDIAKNRDYRIDQVLGNDSVKPKNNIEVSVRYGNRDFETFEYEIT
jgi:hypothetical protein